jgi:hypothetical protein
MTRLFEQGTRRLVYIVLTAAIVVPVWLATKPHLTGRSEPATVQSLDAPADSVRKLGDAAPATPARPAPGAGAGGRFHDTQPLAASFGERRARAAFFGRQLGAGAGAGWAHAGKGPASGRHLAQLRRG